jgi:hypothetical protein
MKSYDPLRLDRAFVLNKDTFCVVFSGKDYDDMYSYILTYEGHLEQPWNRSRPGASPSRATIFLSLEFSSSRAFNRRISSGSRPPYFLRQLKYVAWLIPAFRQISATGTPSSPRFKMNAFRASEPKDREAKTSMPPYFRSFSQPGNYPENSTYERSSFWGSE